MTPDPLDRIRSVRDIPALIAYLRDELDWPIGAEDFDELTFEYEPEELGIDARTAARIEEIKQLRPLAAGQPWGVFFIRFEPKRLPVVVLRRILSQLVVKKRASAGASERAAWDLHDLLFISNYGEGAERQITFAHFTQDAIFGDLPTLKVLGWDDADTALHISHVHHTLKEKLHWPEDEKDSAGWRETWSSAFTLRHRQVITTSKDLAMHLAALARDIRRRAGQVLAIESERGPLRKLHKAFREALIHDLNEDDFADMYAQTIAYGLLASRVSRPMGIIAENVADMVPVTNPFLREMLGTFLTIGGRKGKLDFDELGIQEVVELLNSPDTRMEAILRDFGNRTRQEDPVIHFYELFLAEYDKKMKVKRGVFYTPQPVVSYIVRSVHELLQTEFGLADGLADTTTWGEMATRHPEIKIPDGTSPDTPFVQLLDIATGTATFLVEVIDVIHKTMTAKWEKEGRLALEFEQFWNEYVPKHLLPRLYGYELMMAPYAIAHMKIGLKLYETGYRFGSNERAHIYLTNALEPPQDFSDRLAFDAPALAHEAQAVNAIKRDKRFTVVIGNPPYSQYSMNLNDAAKLHIEKFRFANGQKIRARNALQLERNLNDDYVKFLGFSSGLFPLGTGVLGMVTNRMFLDSESLVGLREWFSTNFERLFIVDLWGSSEESRRVARLAEDENVFDILQGVAISFSVRRCVSSRTANPVRSREVVGKRDEKYALLSESLELRGPGWDETQPMQEAWWLHHNTSGSGVAEHEFTLAEIAPQFSTLVASNRDHLVVNFERNVILQNVRAIQVFRGSNEELAERFNITLKTGWNVTAARQKLVAIPDISSHVHTIEYRPFDRRLIFFHPTLVWQIAPVISNNVRGRFNRILVSLGKNRSETINGQWVTATLADKSVVSTRDNASGFPLYLYNNDELNLGGNAGRPNLSPEFLRQLAARLCVPQVGKFGLPQGVTPEDIFHYIYAVFHSPTYRIRYAEFLTIDFPRLPLTSNLDLFRSLAKLGGELVALHLVEAPVQTGISVCYDETGGWAYDYTTPPPVRITVTGPSEPQVEKVTHAAQTVWIDKAQTQGFRGVPEEVWNFHIGGYQVCEKWLKDRKGRTLDADDLVHYHLIVVALHETICLMAKIDRVIDAHGGWPGAFMANKL